MKTRRWNHGSEWKKTELEKGHTREGDVGKFHILTIAGNGQKPNYALSPPPPPPPSLSPLASLSLSTTTTSSLVHHHHHSLQLSSKLPFPNSLTKTNTLSSNRPVTRFNVSTPTDKPSNSTATSISKKPTTETIYFDGGAHYGDLLANLILGFTLLWLPLTLAAVFRALFLRYRFTNLRVTVISGLTGQDRSDFSYKVIKDVQVVPRFIGEWGDIIITLRDGTKVDLRSVPKFREIAKNCLPLAEKPAVLKETGAKGF
ncbi:unnamed protein product [Malus baccata var. baccata]